MKEFILRLPRYYRECPPMAEWQRVLEQAAGQLQADKDDVLAQLWVDTATWGLDEWERWVGLGIDRSRPYSYRRQRVKAKLRGQGVTTVEMLRGVVSSFGYRADQVEVVEHSDTYQFEIVLTGLAAVPGDVDPIRDAVNEIKPAHLDYWFTYELSRLLTTVRAGGGSWRVRETSLPAAKGE